MAMFKKKSEKGKKKAAPAPAKAAESAPVMAVDAGAVAAAQVKPRMHNAPAWASPESHPALFDDFGNPK